MKLVILFFVLFCFGVVDAQDYYVEELSESNPSFPEDVYVFPIVKGGDPVVAQKMNAYLMENELNIKPGDQKISIFENVWRTEEKFMPDVSDLMFGVNFSNEKLMCISITGEACGAYCEEYENNYTFDLQTGNIVSLKELFTPDGQQELLRQINTYKREVLDKKIAEIKSIIALDTLSSEEDVLYYQEMFYLYESCDANHGSLEYFEYVPSDEYIYIIAERCSSHVDQYVDELWDFEIEIPLSSNIGLLSEKGKEKLLSIQKNQRDK